MSYGEFLGLFLCLPLIALAVLARRDINRPFILWLAVVAAVALLYTAPWDNLIVVNGVWSYSRKQILGVVIGHVPLEEYAFYVLQVGLTGLVARAILQRVSR